MLRVLPWRLRGWVLRIATGAIISAQFGAASLSSSWAIWAPGGVVALRLLTSSYPAVGVLPPADSFVDPLFRQWMAVIVLGVALTGANAFYVAIEQVPLAIVGGY